MSQIANANLTTIWHQEWLTGRELGPREDDSVIRERYIGKLRTSFVRLKDEEDTLVWSLNPSGDYTPKRVKGTCEARGCGAAALVVEEGLEVIHPNHAYSCGYYFIIRLLHGISCKREIHKVPSGSLVG